MRRLATTFVLSALASAGLLALASAPATAGVATVTVDSVTDDGVGCTLREAILTANSGSDTGGCTGGTGGFDVIDFDTIVSGTITLSGSLPAFSQTASVQGPGQANLTIDGAGFRIFEAGPPIGVSNMTLQNGSAGVGPGGAILQNGALNLLTVDGVTFLDNQAGSGGAISAANASVTNSVFRGNDATTPVTGSGGAISTGVLTLTDSTFGGPNAADANTAVFGGGAVSAGGIAGSTTISGSTFQGNTTSGTGPQGAGLRLDGSGTISDSTFASNDATGDGGGLLAINGTINVERSAFFGNGGSSGEALYTFNSDLAVENSTFSNNGNAIRADNSDPFEEMTLTHVTIVNPGATAIQNLGALGSVILTNSVVSNTAASACIGDVVSGGYNLLDAPIPGTCPTGGTNLVGAPVLGALGIGVPGTPPVHHPGSGSPAVDVIPPGSCPELEDQREVTRPNPAGGNCDIGAVEVDFRPDGLIAKTGQSLLGGDTYNANGSGQSVTQQKGKKKTASYDLEVQSDAELSTDAIIARGPGGNRKFAVKYFNSIGDNVTNQVTAPGGYDFSLDPGEQGTLTLEVKVKAKAKSGNQRNTLVTFTSDDFDERLDAVLATTKRK